MNIPEIEKLEKEAEQNEGHCDKCGQTIKIYRYKINRSHALFLRAMAEKAKETGVNNVDINIIGAYSVRSQVTKLRLHGLVARVKNAEGRQIPRRWLITSKGYHFLNGLPVSMTTIVYNNQTLGHGAALTTIYKVLGEASDPNATKYDEEPISPAEAKIYDDVRIPKKLMEIDAIYKRRGLSRTLDVGKTYSLSIEKLKVGSPVVITMPEKMTYKDIAAFRKDWRAI